jgi:hypothetical protein
MHILGEASWKGPAFLQKRQKQVAKEAPEQE